MKKALRIIHNQNGVSAIILALALIALLGFAALAATRELGRIYSEETLVSQDFSSVGNAAFLSSIYDTAITVAGKNVAAGSEVSISTGDIAIGQWDRDTRTLTETLVEPDAVRVTPRRETSGGRAVTLFFARALGIFDADVSATATAALTGLSEINEGDLTIPVGISEEWFNRSTSDGFCGQTIKFYPTSDEGCAGWTTFDRWPSSATQLRNILGGLKDHSYSAPGAVAYETQFVFDGGVKESTIFNKNHDDFMDLYLQERNPVTLEWETYVPIYTAPCSRNPNGWITVVGFAKATIYEVLESPDKLIRARVECKKYDPDNRGGGGYYGLKGSIPGLVQ